jgi:hypothetical protein
MHAISPSISLEPSRSVKVANAEDTGGMNLAEEDDDMEDDVGMDDSAEKRYDDSEDSHPI